MLRDSLIAGLQKFPYPYPECRRDEKKRITFYKRVELAGILDSLLNGKLFWTIHWWLVLQTASEMEKDLSDENFSPYYCPATFHREMTEELIAHVTKIHELLRRHEVNKEWAIEHLNAVDRQLVREVRSIFWYHPSLPLTEKVMFSPRDFQVELHDAFIQALEKARAGKGKKTLAIQLTSLVCSSLACVHTGVLDPSPEAIRKKIETEKKKSRKN